METITRNSLVFRAFRAFGKIVANSYSARLFKAGIAHSLILKPLMEEDNSKDEWVEPAPIEIPSKENPSKKAWWERSFFLRILWTWKDCEENDRYT